MHALQGWRPWEPAAQALLLPWQPVWSAKEWAAATDRVVVPPLEAAMHELLSLNPLEPDTRPCDWCLAWTGSLSTAQLAGAINMLRHRTPTPAQFCSPLFVVCGLWGRHARLESCGATAGGAPGCRELVLRNARAACTDFMHLRHSGYLPHIE